VRSKNGIFSTWKMHLSLALKHKLDPHVHVHTINCAKDRSHAYCIFSCKAQN